MIVLDANVLIYAVGRDHELREPCRAIVAAIRDGRVQATTTVGVIDEFVHVHARGRDRMAAVRWADRYAVLLSPLLMHEESDVRAALNLFERIDALNASDSFLAAAALRAKAEALVSADKGFDRVPRLRYLHPASSELSALLAVEET